MAEDYAQLDLDAPDGPLRVGGFTFLHISGVTPDDRQRHFSLRCKVSRNPPKDNLENFQYKASTILLEEESVRDNTQAHAMTQLVLLTTRNNPFALPKGLVRAAPLRRCHTLTDSYYYIKAKTPLRLAYPATLRNVTYKWLDRCEPRDLIDARGKEELITLATELMERLRNERKLSNAEYTSEDDAGDGESNGGDEEDDDYSGSDDQEERKSPISRRGRPLARREVVLLRDSPKEVEEAHEKFRANQAAKKKDGAAPAKAVVTSSSSSSRRKASSQPTDNSNTSKSGRNSKLSRNASSSSTSSSALKSAQDARDTKSQQQVRRGRAGPGGRGGEEEDGDKSSSSILSVKRNASGNLTNPGKTRKRTTSVGGYGSRGGVADNRAVAKKENGSGVVSGRGRSRNPHSNVSMDTPACLSTPMSTTSHNTAIAIAAAHAATNGKVSAASFPSHPPHSHKGIKVTNDDDDDDDDDEDDDGGSDKHANMPGNPAASSYLRPFPAATEGEGPYLSYGDSHHHIYHSRRHSHEGLRDDIINAHALTAPNGLSLPHSQHASTQLSLASTPATTLAPPSLPWSSSRSRGVRPPSLSRTSSNGASSQSIHPVFAFGAMLHLPHQAAQRDQSPSSAVAAAALAQMTPASHSQDPRNYTHSNNTLHGNSTANSTHSIINGKELDRNLIEGRHEGLSFLKGNRTDLTTISGHGIAQDNLESITPPAQFLHSPSSNSHQYRHTNSQFFSHSYYHS